MMILLLDIDFDNLIDPQATAISLNLKVSQRACLVAGHLAPT